MIRTEANWGILSLQCLILLAAGIVIATFGYLAWLRFMDPVTPLIRQKLVDVRMDNHPNHPTVLAVTREMCLDTDAAATVIRVINDGAGNAYLPPVPAVLSAGCHIRIRGVEIPPFLVPGTWTLRIGYRWCNVVDRCVMEWFPEIEMDVAQGGQGLELVGIRERPGHDAKDRR